MPQANTNSDKTAIRFPLGKLVATPAAVDAMQEAAQNPHELFQRRQLGDWGEVCPGGRCRKRPIGERWLQRG